MPYHVGKKGSNGCSGFPVVTDKGKVMGCHPTQSHADRQVAALYANGAAEKGMNIFSNFLSKPNSKIDKKQRVLEVCDCFDQCYCND